MASRPDRAGRYIVRFDDGTALRLYRQTVEDFGLYPGAELSESQLDGLKAAAGAMSAKMRAVRIVTAGTVTAEDLQRRLTQKGENPAQAREAVAWMQQLELVDDRQAAEQIVSSCIRKGYGVARARQMLYEKRVPRELWDEALADYPDQDEAIAAFLQRRLGASPTPQEVRRATDALLRRGHSYSDIRRGLQALSEDADGFSED